MLFSGEAFAFQLDEGWEVNAAAQVKGFKQAETDDIYTGSVKFEADLTLPDGEIYKNLISNTVTKSKDGEEMLDMQIEMQFNLDGDFEVGSYSLKVIAEDVNSPEGYTKRDTLIIPFKLESF